MAAYRWMATPPCSSGPPLPPQVFTPSRKSVGAAGIGSGFQRSWFGVTGPWPNVLSQPAAPSNASNGLCCAPGRMRYSQERRFSLRGAVKAVPESCSAYRPYGHCCGELRPTGSAPGKASVAQSLPKPVRYCSSMESSWVAARCVAARSVWGRLQKQRQCVIVGKNHHYGYGNVKIQTINFVNSRGRQWPNCATSI
ncbi:hypothetical protein D3C72_984750 [compost metagenome]